MNGFVDVLLNIAVLVGILLAAALVTGFFTRAMYYKCGGCAALNARRRSHCRLCGTELG